MTDQVIKTLTDPAFLIALLVGIAVFATAFTLMPAFGGNTLKSRMKSVALEREELRARQRARLAAEEDAFRERWGAVLEHADPAYHPALARALPGRAGVHGFDEAGELGGALAITLHHRDLGGETHHHIRSGPVVADEMEIG